MRDIPEPSHSRAPNWHVSVLWGLAAVLAAVACALVSARLQRAWEQDPPLTQGMLTGIFVGALAGARTRRLAGWILGPMLGAGVGWLDLACLEPLLRCDRISYFAAASVPTWGLAGALALTVTRRRWSTVACVTLVAAATDLFARWSMPFATGYACAVRDASMAADLLVYAPTSFVLVFAAGWRQENTRAPETADMRLGWLRKRPAVCFAAAIVGGAAILLGVPNRGVQHSASEPGSSWPRPAMPAEPIETTFRETDEFVSAEFARAGYALVPHYRYARRGSEFFCNGYDPARNVGFLLSTDDGSADDPALDPDERSRIEDEALAGREFVLVIPFSGDSFLLPPAALRSGLAELVADPSRRQLIRNAPRESLRRARDLLAEVVEPWLRGVQERRK